MIVFSTIALAFFIVLAFSLLFGHDVDHDVDHGIGDDAGGTVSIFSTKVIATLGLGFGAVGAIAKYYGNGYMASSVYGVLGGIVVAFLAYLILCFFYKQQVSSSINLTDLTGLLGIVTVSISSDSAGEVGITYKGQYDTYMAIPNNGVAISKAAHIKVIGIAGNQLKVEKF